MKLINYSHDRNANFKKSSDELFELIEKFGEQKQLDDFFDHYEKRYSIPKKILKHNLKRDILRHYKYKSARFGKKLKLITLPFSIVKYIGFLFFSLIFSRKHGKKRHYKLIVDEIDHSLYLHRFSKLINLFGKEDVLVIATGEIDVSEFPDYNIKRLRLFKYHDRFEVLKVIYYELFSGLWVCLRTSIQVGLNLFPESMVIVTTYLRYKCLFKLYSADFLIQERLYTTNAIKNYLFKESGGTATATIQKSILELDQMSYYIDIDYFFSLGNRTTERAFQYGARIDRVIPVGSMFMEYNWFSGPQVVEKNIDVIMLGLNIMNAYERENKYEEFMDDYYHLIRWLVRFKEEHPSYRVAIKHHGSAGEDEIENKIISGSGVEVLPKDGNSYQFAFNSRCAVTYGSTMGYEMTAHGVPTFFIDPGYRNTFLPDPDDNLIKGLRVTSYGSFCDALLDVLDDSNVKKGWHGKLDDLCLNSSTVSDRIYKKLKSLKYSKIFK